MSLQSVSCRTASKYEHFSKAVSNHLPSAGGHRRYSPSPGWVSWGPSATGWIWICWPTLPEGGPTGTWSWIGDWEYRTNELIKVWPTCTSWAASPTHQPSGLLQGV